LIDEGLQYGDLELHIVHICDELEETDNKFLVIGIVFSRYQYFNEGEIMAKLNLKKGNIELDLSSMLKGLGNPIEGFHYFGSLTTPPCTLAVNWIVLKKVFKISFDDYWNAFDYDELTYLPNHRPPVEYYD